MEFHSYNQTEMEEKRDSQNVKLFKADKLIENFAQSQYPFQLKELTLDGSNALASRAN